MRANRLFCMAAAAVLNGCSSFDFGDALIDTAWVAADAQEIKECRDAYRLTEDRLRLAVCDSEARN